MPDLRAAAEAAKNNPWHAGKVINRETLEFTRLATPGAILELYAERDRLAEERQDMRELLNQLDAAKDDDERAGILSVMRELVDPDSMLVEMKDEFNLD